MASLDKLTQMLSELDDLLVSCMRCGMCQSVCPVFKETGKESDVTRGKISLLAGLGNKIALDVDSVNERLNSCLLCGTCQVNCPSGVKIMDIFLKARSIFVEYLGLSFVKKIVFKKMLTNPKLFNFVLDLSGKFQWVALKKVSKSAQNTNCFRVKLPLLADRHINSLAPKAFHKICPELNTPKGKSNLKVAVYVGCMADKIYPEIAQSIIKVLEHHGVGIFMPPAQACCGIPLLASGERTAYDELVAYNIDSFKKEDFDYLVTGCASCTSTIKELWGKEYKGSAGDNKFLQELSEKTMDITEFLVDILQVKGLESKKDAKKITYHDPCHLKNMLKITAQPRTLLQANANYSLEELDASSCCGCGGSYTLFNYPTARKIGSKKIKNITDKNIELIATTCPACMLQLNDLSSQEKTNIIVKHVIEIYADSL